MVEDCFGSIHVANLISFQRESDFLLFCPFLKSQLAGRWEIFDYNTITAKLKLRLKLSLAIQAKKFYVLPNGKTGKKPQAIHLMNFNRELHKMSIFTEKLVRALLIFD